MGCGIGVKRHRHNCIFDRSLHLVSSRGPGSSQLHHHLAHVLPPEKANERACRLLDPLHDCFLVLQGPFGLKGRLHPDLNSRKAGGATGPRGVDIRALALLQFADRSFAWPARFSPPWSFAAGVPSLGVVRPLGGSGGLHHSIMLCFGDAFFDEPFIIAAPLLVLVVIPANQHFMAREARHRIPAF